MCSIWILICSCDILSLTGAPYQGGGELLAHWNVMLIMWEAMCDCLSWLPCLVYKSPFKNKKSVCVCVWASGGAAGGSGMEFSCQQPREWFDFLETIRDGVHRLSRRSGVRLAGVFGQIYWGGWGWAKETRSMGVQGARSLSPSTFHYTAPHPGAAILPV